MANRVSANATPDEVFEAVKTVADSIKNTLETLAKNPMGSESGKAQAEKCRQKTDEFYDTAGSIVNSFVNTNANENRSSFGLGGNNSSATSSSNGKSGDR